MSRFDLIKKGEKMNPVLDHTNTNQMNRASESLFGHLPHRVAIFFLIYSITYGILFGLGLFQFLKLITFLALIICAKQNPFKCLGIYIIVMPFMNILFPSSITVAICLMVGMVFTVKNKMIVNNKVYLIYLVASFLIILLSYLLGYNSKVTTGLLMCIIVFLIISMLNYSNLIIETDISTVAFSFFCRAICLTVYFIVSYACGVNTLKYGRLSFYEDIKPVAFTALIPLLFIICSKMEGKTCFSNWKNAFVDYIMVVVFATIIILTAARGMIFAGVLTVLGMGLFTQNKTKTFWKFLPIIAICIVVFSNMLDVEKFRIARIIDFSSDEFGELNGRTDIWSDYLYALSNSGFVRVFFGFGPGDSGRIISGGAYAHSTFLDFFISYGCIGFLMMIVFEIISLVKLFVKKEWVLLTVMIFSIIAESTHGVSANIMLFTLQAFLLLTYESRNNIKQRGVV